MRRLGIAFIFALIVHLGFAALIHPFQHVPQRTVRSEPIVYFHVIVLPRKLMTPRPIVRPVPHRIIRRIVPRFVEHARSRSSEGTRARDAGKAHSASHAAPAIVVHRELAVPTAAPLPPLVRVRAVEVSAAVKVGPGTIAGTAGLTGGANGGNSGIAGTGQGAGAVGGGTGDGIVPCGDITISPFGPIKTYDGLEHINVTIKVQFKDGSESPKVPLPYPLVYKSDAENPFPKRKKQILMLLQFPPPDMDTTTFPPLIQFVLKHTTPDGFTLLDECSSGAP